MVNNNINNNDSGMVNDNGNINNNTQDVTEINNNDGVIVAHDHHVINPTPKKDWVTALDPPKKKQRDSSVNMTGVAIGRTRSPVNIDNNNNNSGDDEFTKLMKLQFAQQQIEAHQRRIENEEKERQHKIEREERIEEEDRKRRIDREERDEQRRIEREERLALER
jgi:hypothetical protein